MTDSTGALTAKMGPYAAAVHTIAPNLAHVVTTEASPRVAVADALSKMLQATKPTPEPDNLSGAALFVPGAAAFVAGQTLPVDGGLVRH